MERNVTGLHLPILKSVASVQRWISLVEIVMHVQLCPAMDARKSRAMRTGLIPTTSLVTDVKKSAMILRVKVQYKIPPAARVLVLLRFNVVLLYVLRATTRIRVDRARAHAIVLPAMIQC